MDPRTLDRIKRVSSSGAPVNGNMDSWDQIGEGSQDASNPVAPSLKKDGKILGFMGIKGGVGTTTVAVNIALTLVKGGHRVVIAELREDPGSLAQQVGVVPDRNVSSLLSLDPSALNANVIEPVLATHQTGLRLLCGPQRLTECKHMSFDQIQGLLRGLAPLADFVIVDWSRFPLPANRTALSGCHLLVLVLEPDPICLQLGRITLDFSQSCYEGPVEVVVVNRSGAQVAMPASEMREILGREIAGVIPPAPELALTAIQSKRPLVLGQPDSLPATSMGDVACRLIADLNGNEFEVKRERRRQDRRRMDRRRW